MAEVIADAVKDSLVIFPFLFLVYVLMEMIESASKKEKIEKALSGEFAPVFASVTGVIPECGFSVMCAKLFDSGLITLGTLIAAFISTSDEGVIILLSEGEGAKYAAAVVGVKIVYAVFVGVLLNVALKKFDNRHVCPAKDLCVECGERHGGFLDKFVLHPFYHAAKVFIYILAVNFVLSAAFYFIGEDNLYSFMTSVKPLEPLFTSAFGLIPNCASSIILARGFGYGVLTFSGLISGLAANSGVGVLILFKNKKRVKTGLLVLGIMYISGVLIGYAFLPVS